MLLYGCYDHEELLNYNYGFYKYLYVRDFFEIKCHKYKKSFIPLRMPKKKKTKTNGGVEYEVLIDEIKKFHSIIYGIFKDDHISFKIHNYFDILKYLINNENNHAKLSERYKNQLSTKWKYLQIIKEKIKYNNIKIREYWRKDVKHQIKNIKEIRQKIYKVIEDFEPILNNIRYVSYFIGDNVQNIVDFNRIDDINNIFQVENVLTNDINIICETYPRNIKKRKYTEVELYQEILYARRLLQMAYNYMHMIDKTLELLKLRYRFL